MSSKRWFVFCALWPLAAQAQTAAVMHFSTGTGFFVSGEGYLLTNNHVIDKCTKYSVYSKQASMQAELVAKDEENDLALLKTSFAVADIGSFNSLAAPLARGDRLIVAGFPGKAWETRTTVVRDTTILELAGPQGEPNLLQFADSVAEGNSGGPLLDLSGNVVGVVRAKTTITEVNMRTHETQSVRHADVAINLPTVIAFLNRYDVPYTEEDSTSALSEKAVAEKAKGFIVNVRCRLD